MKLIFKEQPEEWRKAALLGALGFMILSTVLRWRHHLSAPVWIALLAALATVMICACLQPRWFRGYYRFTTRVGFFIAELVGRVILTAFFLLVLTPFGLALRLSGKDPLRLKRPRGVESYWTPARESSPLDRLF